MLIGKPANFPLSMMLFSVSECVRLWMVIEDCAFRPNLHYYILDTTAIVWHIWKAFTSIVNQSWELYSVSLKSHVHFSPKGLKNFPCRSKNGVRPYPIRENYWAKWPIMQCQAHKKVYNIIRVPHTQFCYKWETNSTFPVCLEWVPTFRMGVGPVSYTHLTLPTTPYV